MMQASSNMICALLIGASFSVAAEAQAPESSDGLDYVTEYGATIAETDRVSSGGTRLTKAADILQQDRYNVDVRGILQPGDSVDDHFGDTTHRAEIAKADIRFSDEKAKTDMAGGTPSLFVTVMRQTGDGRLVVFLATSDGEPADDPDADAT